ncbi:sulfite exporter TauE/SafE family protein [Alloscardovia criceti]|uniref:sulfite exporter TauE/SafE family protein n=1 Tax=Alloscardovia criceti TaxID=356828 RepID=UPI00035FEC17|nr:sulfite exporter TauE/SafE family protein [Alloscardovia criceti]
MYNALFGFLIGVFVSLIGGGGASLYLGVLSGQLSTATAVSTSLFVALPALFFGTLSQMHIHNVQFKTGNRLILAALPSILVGTFLSRYIPETIYAILIGMLLIIMGAIVLRKNVLALGHHSVSNDSPEPQESKHGPWSAYGLGALSGLMVGLGGLSGGATTMAGLSIMGLSTFEAAGTSTYVLCAMSLVGFISHALTASIAWSAGATLMLGAIIGSVLTPLILSRINLKKIDSRFGIFLGILIIYFGVKMFVTL